MFQPDIINQPQLQKAEIYICGVTTHQNNLTMIQQQANHQQLVCQMVIIYMKQVTT